MDIRHTARAAAISLACVFLCYASAFAQKTTSIDVNQLRFMEKARKIVTAVNSHDVDAIENMFDPIMKREMPPKVLKPLIWKLTEQLGSIQELGDVRIKWSDVAVIPVKFEKGVLDLQIAIDSADRLSGLFFLPHRVEAPVPTRNSVKLSLPVTGRWNVVWGGDTKEQNYHHDVKNQRFALDMNVTDPIGNSHNNEGKVNSDFLAWGKEVVAPADGVVTEAIDGVRDNEPFSGNEYEALGNAVVIRIAENQYFVIAHLQRGSVKVKYGDSVTRGQLLGLCGNSGNSTEPHVHCHLQNTEAMQDAYGIKMYFDKVGVQRKKEIEKIESDYSPIRDEWVENK